MFRYTSGLLLGAQCPYNSKLLIRFRRLFKLLSVVLLATANRVCLVISDSTICDLKSSTIAGCDSLQWAISLIGHILYGDVLSRYGTYLPDGIVFNVRHD